MFGPQFRKRIELVTAVRRSGLRAMSALLVVAAFAILTRVAVPWISLGVVAGVLVFGCLAVCVLTAVLDGRAWRGIEHDLELLRRGAGRSEAEAAGHLPRHRREPPMSSVDASRPFGHARNRPLLNRCRRLRAGPRRGQSSPARRVS